MLAGSGEENKKADMKGVGRQRGRKRKGREKGRKREKGPEGE